jgi:hypothetical protein
MGTPGRPASSARLAIDMARVRLAVHPSILVLYHVITGSRDSTHVAPWPLWQGLVVVVIVVPTYVTPSQRERGTGTGRRVVFDYVPVSPPTWWTRLCGAPTIVPYCPRQQSVRPCRSPRLGMAAHLRFQGLPLPAPCLARFQGPRVQFIDLEVVGLLSTSCHRTSQFYRCAGRSSLMSWGTFRAAWSMPVQDVLVAAAIALLARESRELVRDVSHHG